MLLNTGLMENINRVFRHLGVPVRNVRDRMKTLTYRKLYFRHMANFIRWGELHSACLLYLYLK